MGHPQQMEIGAMTRTDLMGSLSEWIRGLNGGI